MSDNKQRQRRRVIIETFKPYKKNTLLGFARVRLPSGMILSEVTIQRSGDSVWASPPAKPMLNRDGSPLRDAAGKVRYAQIIEFENKELRDLFSRAVIEAVRETHPDALT